jgi:hypothetical protein
MREIRTQKTIELDDEEVRKLKEAYSVLGDIWFKLDIEDEIIVNGTRYRHTLLNLAMRVIQDFSETSDIKVVKGE